MAHAAWEGRKGTCDSVADASGSHCHQRWTGYPLAHAAREGCKGTRDSVADASGSHCQQRWTRYALAHAAWTDNLVTRKADSAVKLSSANSKERRAALEEHFRAGG